MDDYQLVESFDIDDGSLDALTREQCFVLGVEWEAFRSRIAESEQFTDLCHSANVRRIAALAERHGRYVEYHDDDDGWSEVFVGALRD